MSQLIDEIIGELKEELGLSKYEIEKITDIQFKCLADNIRLKSTKTVNMIYLGKFRPTGWFLRNQDKFKGTKEEYEAHKKLKRDNARLAKLSEQQSGSKTTGGAENVNL